MIWFQVLLFMLELYCSHAEQFEGTTPTSYHVELVESIPIADQSFGAIATLNTSYDSGRLTFVVLMNMTVGQPNCSNCSTVYLINKQKRNTKSVQLSIWVQLFGFESLIHSDRTAVNLPDSLQSQIMYWLAGIDKRAYYQRGIVQLHSLPSTVTTGNLYRQSATFGAGGALYLIDTYTNINPNSFQGFEAPIYGEAIYVDLTPELYTKLVEQNAALLFFDSMRDRYQILRNPNLKFTQNSIVGWKANIGSVGYYPRQMAILISDYQTPNRAEALLPMKNILAVKPSNQTTFVEAFIMTTIVSPMDLAIYNISSIRWGNNTELYSLYTELRYCMLCVGFPRGHFLPLGDSFELNPFQINQEFPPYILFYLIQDLQRADYEHPSFEDFSDQAILPQHHTITIIPQHNSTTIIPQPNVRTNFPSTDAEIPPQVMFIQTFEELQRADYEHPSFEIFSDQSIIPEHHIITIPELNTISIIPQNHPQTNFHSTVTEIPPN